MKCTLCKKEIEKYDETFNHLKIDENSSADFCSECIDKFLRWQQERFAKLFPTSYAKRMIKRKGN